MCSIGGVCYTGIGTDSVQVVNSMLTKTLHRGRLGPTVKQLDDRCTFGHTRLAIVGDKSNVQPMAIDGVWITFNGEIYNYLDLRTDLINKGRRFTTKRGDSEVIINAYLVYGLAFVEKLRGIFSFALYDTRNKTLIICRDRVGVKPLYYCTDSVTGVFAFASEIKALLGTVIPSQNIAVDYDSLCQYLHFQHCLGARTLFRGVSKVLPGEMLILNASTGDLRAVTYWDIDVAKVREATTGYFTEDYYKDRILSVLSRVIREQATNVQAGAYVSGGIDSSTVAALLMEYTPELKTIVGEYDVAGYSEASYAHQLIESVGGYNKQNFSCLTITADMVIDSLKDAIYHLDEPCVGPGLIGQYLVAKQIKETYPDLKVMFGGQGGDELFGGYARYIIAYLESCLYGAIYPDKSRDYVMTLDKLVPMLPVLQGYEPMLKTFFRGNMFGDRDRRYFDLICRSQESALSPNFLRMWYEPSKSHVYEDYLSIFSALGGVSYFTRMTYFDFKASLPALLQVDDRVNAAFELESRVPLLDDELIGLAFSIPPTHKFHGGMSKGLLRKALVGVVPETILNRRDKMGFPVPFTEWMKTSLRMKDFVHSTLDNKFLNSVYKKRDTDTFDRSMWGRLSLALWQETFKVSY